MGNQIINDGFSLEAIEAHGTDVRIAGRKVQVTGLGRAGLKHHLRLLFHEVEAELTFVDLRFAGGVVMELKIERGALRHELAGPFRELWRHIAWRPGGE